MTICINHSLNLHSVEQQRQEFFGVGNKLYFNFGGQGTLPRSALEAIIDTYNYLQLHGPFSLKINAWIDYKIQQLKEAIATELTITADTITLTENVTDGCNIVLWGLPWQAGDHILLTDCEHPGIIAIVQELSRRFQLEVSTCAIRATLNQGNPVQEIANKLRPQTRLVILSHLLWNTGQILPLADIVQLCHYHSPSQQSIPILVDAAQSVGCLPLNLTELEIDFYAFTGHKWFCGPAGVGGLYIRPEMMAQVSPTFIGWRSIQTDAYGQPKAWKPDGRRYEVATSAYPVYEGLRSAITVHQEWGNQEKRYENICQLSEYLWRGLSQLDGVSCLKNSPPEAGLVSFTVRENLSHTKLVQSLEQQGFLLRTIANPDCIRACVHYFTLPAEIEHLIQAVDQAIH
jgi:L-cysteine/cystine lyase